MTTAAPTSALVTIQPAFTDPERLALAGFLAGYRGLTREAAAMADARARMAVDRGFVPASWSAVRPPGPQSAAGLRDGSTYSR